MHSNSSGAVINQLVLRGMTRHLYCQDTFCGVIWDFNTELFFKCHNQFSGIRAVCSRSSMKLARQPYRHQRPNVQQQYFYTICNIAHKCPLLEAWMLAESGRRNQKLAADNIVFVDTPPCLFIIMVCMPKSKHCHTTIHMKCCAGNIGCLVA